MIWRIASLILTGAPVALIVVKGLTFALRGVGWCTRGRSTAIESTSLDLAVYLATGARETLVGLMFASLRAVPCSAYQTVSWATYIPHL